MMSDMSLTPRNRKFIPNSALQPLLAPCFDLPCNKQKTQRLSHFFFMQLIYESFARYLVEQKGYEKDLLNLTPATWDFW